MHISQDATNSTIDKDTFPKTFGPLDTQEVMIGLDMVIRDPGAVSEKLGHCK